mmetsp:Transcript_39837/g.93411  ORF Transcript_39837/g.93411 Transcript_39837/m.93411 type:complete len:240 (-) Transcript_39837:404-1123(-)
MISVDTTRARPPPSPPRACSSVLARSIEIGDAEQPIPERLYVFTSCRMLNFCMTMEQRLGVGEKRLQLMMRMSISWADTPALRRASSTTVQMTVSASSRLRSIERSAGLPFRHWTIAGGHAVAWPVPLRSRIRDMKSTESLLKHFWARIMSRIWEWLIFQPDGALKVLNANRYTGLSCLANTHTTINDNSEALTPVVSKIGSCTTSVYTLIISFNTRSGWSRTAVKIWCTRTSSSSSKK